MFTYNNWYYQVLRSNIHIQLILIWGLLIPHWWRIRPYFGPTRSKENVLWLLTSRYSLTRLTLHIRFIENSIRTNRALPTISLEHLLLHYIISSSSFHSTQKLWTKYRSTFRDWIDNNHPSSRRKEYYKKKKTKFGNKSKHFSHSKRVSKFTHQIQIQQNKNAFEIVYSHSISNATHNKQQTTSSLAVAIIVLLLVLGPPSHVARWDSQKTWIQQIHA